MHTDTHVETSKLNEEEFNPIKLIKNGSIRLKISIDVFFVPLIIYKLSNLLNVSNFYLHISLIVAIIQLCINNYVLLCIFSYIPFIFICKSLEPPKYTLICFVLYIIISFIGYCKLKSSEICIISQLITILFYLEHKLDYENFTLFLMHKLTLNVTVIVIAYSIFLYTCKAIVSASLISQMLWFNTFDWLITISNGIRPIQWIFNQIVTYIHIILIWAVISTFFILIMLFKLRFKHNKTIISSLRKDIHFLLSSIIIVSLYLDNKSMIILALDGVLLGFMALEMARHSKVEFVINKLQHLRILYNDRDSDELLFIHLFIIIGMLIPLLTSVVLGKDGIFNRWVLGCVGVYSIGLADSMASIIGMVVSGPTLPYSNKKTLFGSLSFFTVLFTFLSIASYITNCYDVVKIAIVSFITALYEGYTDSSDNLTVPLVSTLILLYLGEK